MRKKRKETEKKATPNVLPVEKSQKETKGKNSHPVYFAQNQKYPSQKQTEKSNQMAF